MRKFLALLPLIVLFAVAPAHSRGDLAVVLETSPAPEQIGPDETLVRTTLRVVDAGGQAVPNARLKLRLEAPPGQPLISTDFPLVERTTLLAYEGTLPDGVWQFDYVYPIRGTYSFEVAAGTDPGSYAVRDTLKLRLRENRREVLNLVIFLGGLLGFGLVTGVIVGRGARARSLAAAGLSLLLLALALPGGPAATALAHGGEHETGPVTDSATSGDLTLTSTLRPGGGRVGALNYLTFQATDGQGRPAPGAEFNLSLWHVEDDRPVFAATLPAPQGRADLAFQFFDGAEHRLQVSAARSASPGADTVSLERVVGVEGLSPPLATKIRTLVLLLLVVLAGVVIGLRVEAGRDRKRESLPVAA